MLKHHTQTVGSEMWYIKTLQCQVIFPTFCSSCSMCHDWAHQCKGMSLHLQPITYFSCCTVSHEYWRNILLQYSALYLRLLTFLLEVPHTHPIVWKVDQNQHKNYLPSGIFGSQNRSKDFEIQSDGPNVISYSSATLMQRLTLFICVDTNNWRRLASSITSAVFSVNSGQLFPEISISVEKL